MTTVFWTRNGTRVPRKAVAKARMDYARAKRTGKLGELPMSIQPSVADAIECMRDEDFADWSGAYTWRKLSK